MDGLCENLPAAAAVDERWTPAAEAHPARRQPTVEVGADLRAGGAASGPALHKREPAGGEPEDDHEHRVLPLDQPVPVVTAGDVVVRDLHGAGERAAGGGLVVPDFAVVGLHDYDTGPAAAAEGVLEHAGERAEARVLLLRRVVGLHEVQLLRRPRAACGQRLQLRQDRPRHGRVLRGPRAGGEGRGSLAAALPGGKRAPPV